MTVLPTAMNLALERSYEVEYALRAYAANDNKARALASDGHYGMFGAYYGASTGTYRPGTYRGAGSPGSAKVLEFPEIGFNPEKVFSKSRTETARNYEPFVGTLQRAA